MIIAPKSLLIHACSQYDTGQPYLVTLGTLYHHIDEADFKENKQVTQSARYGSQSRHSVIIRLARLIKFGKS